nr:flavodoxin [Myxococcus xanthus]
MVPVAVTFIEKRHARELQRLVPYVGPLTDGQGGTSVVYFSRSGNIALAARHIANRLGAQLFELDAPDYRLGLAGWANAMHDARGEEADISPREMDLSRFDTVYLGSPVWLYSPAPPIWAFVENNRFDGKRVVLFNTFNSELSEDSIARFRVKVMARARLSTMPPGGGG